MNGPRGGKQFINHEAVDFSHVHVEVGGLVCRGHGLQNTKICVKMAKMLVSPNF